MANLFTPNSFIENTDVYDVDVIQELDINSEEFRLFLVRLVQSIRGIRNVVNTTTSGYQVNQETVNGKIFNSSTSSEPVNGWCKELLIGPLANAAGTTPYAHGIDFGTTATAQSSVRLTALYGGASNTTSLSYLPLPYPSATAADVIEVSMDNTNVYITVGKDQSAYDQVYIYIEYIK